MVSFDPLMADAITSDTRLTSIASILNARMVVVTRSDVSWRVLRVPVARLATASRAIKDSSVERPDCASKVMPFEISPVENMVRLATSSILSPIIDNWAFVTSPIMASRFLNAWSNVAISFIPATNASTTL